MSIDSLAVNTIRFLAVDAVQKANSGHPGMPMGASPMAYALWSRHLKHNPTNPSWPDRDRFVLSAGHGSMLLYALLHLTGYDLPLDELKNFRQWGSRTPGHPESHLTAGVETTTGPLGQGFSNGVGMAIAERFLAAHFNKPDCTVVDHFTYGIVSDGDLMEGVSHEAASLAGHLGLGKLIYLYDDNGISIDGSTKLSFSENVGKRFEAYGWHVQHVEDGNDVEAIDAAIVRARAETERPSIVAVRTIIGFGSPNLQNTSKSHGSPLGEDEVVLTKRNLDWPEDEPFHIPEDVLTHMRRAKDEGSGRQKTWEDTMVTYRDGYPELAGRFDNWMTGSVSPDWEAALPHFQAGDKMATRSASGKVLEAIVPVLGNLVGGSADLTPSNNTRTGAQEDFQKATPGGGYFRFGVREHGMAAICNGIALHGGLRPYGATFLVFSDYLRPSLRLSALMHIPVIYIFTHDSIGLGEDGPTHQAVEHFAALRAIPGLVFLRPADANETVEAWRVAIQADGPVAFALSRQGLPTQPTAAATVRDGVRRGAYVVHDSEGAPDLILIATGSELSLAVQAAGVLTEEGTAVRVVSMPSWELFEKQPESYRDEVLPPSVAKRISIEAGVTMGWRRWVGDRGVSIGLDRFGASAPGSVAMEKLGFSVTNVVKKARDLMVVHEPEVNGTS